MRTFWSHRRGGRRAQRCQPPSHSGSPTPPPEGGGRGRPQRGSCVPGRPATSKTRACSPASAPRVGRCSMPSNAPHDDPSRFRLSELLNVASDSAATTPCFEPRTCRESDALRAALGLHSATSRRADSARPPSSAGRRPCGGASWMTSRGSRPFPESELHRGPGRIAPTRTNGPPTLRPALAADATVCRRNTQRANGQLDSFRAVLRWTRS